MLLDNHGFKSIGALSRSLGQEGFGTRYAYPQDGVLPGDTAGETARRCRSTWPPTPRSLGAHVIECADATTTLWPRCRAARDTDRTTVIYIQNDRYVGVPGYESWWDVPVAEVSEMPRVRGGARRVGGDARVKSDCFNLFTLLRSYERNNVNNRL